LSGALSGDVPGTFGPAIGDCGGAAVALPIPRRGEIMTNRFLFAAAETIITRQWRRAGQWRVSPMGQDMSARYFKDEAATGALACAAATALLLVLGAPARADECADLRAKLEQIQGQIAVEESMVRSYSDIANDSDRNAKKAYDRASASNKRDDWTTYYYFEASHKRDLTYVAEDKATLAKYQSDAADVQKAIAFVCPDTPPAPPPTKADAPPAPNNPPASPSSAGGTDTTTPTSPVTPTADAPLPPSAPTTPTTTAATPAPLPPVQVGPSDTTTGFNVPPPTDSGGPTDQPSPSPEPLPVAALPPVMLPAPPGPSDPGNLPAVWCVMRNGTQKTVIRCDDTTGAGMGWTLVDSNLTWPAATLEAFGAAATSPGPAYRPSTPSGSPATIAGLGATGPLNAPPPGPSGSFPRATPRAGDSAGAIDFRPLTTTTCDWVRQQDNVARLIERDTQILNIEGDAVKEYHDRLDAADRAAERNTTNLDNYIQFLRSHASAFVDPNAPPDVQNSQREALLKKIKDSAERSFQAANDDRNEAEAALSQLETQIAVARACIAGREAQLNNPSSQAAGTPAKGEGEPPQPLPPPTIQVNAPPQSPPLPPITVPASTPASSPKACTPYACNYMQSTLGGAAQSGGYEMDVCVPASGDWSAATCTIDSINLAHAAAGQANPDSRTTCGPRPFFGVVKDHDSFVQQCKSLNGRVTEPQPPTHADVKEPPAKTHKPATPRVATHPATPSHPNEQPAQSIDPAAAAAAISILGGMMGGGGFRGGGGGGGGHPCHR
jgi:hypothetical protein